jgi:hypothetical protein
MLVQLGKALGKFFIKTAPALLAQFTAKDYTASN